MQPHLLDYLVLPERHQTYMMKTFTVLSLAAAVICMVTCENNIERPCESDLTLDCVRKYFSEKGDCDVVENANDNPFYEEYFPIYMPKINLTVITTTFSASNLNGDIKTFYIDWRTRNVVMSVKFKDVFCDAPDTILLVSRKGKEPSVIKDYINATYDTMLTAVIPLSPSDGINQESLKSARISAHFEGVDGLIQSGTKFSDSDDADIAATYAALFGDFSTSLLEIFRTTASFFFLIYLENYVCDFKAGVTLKYQYDTTVANSILEHGSDADDISEPCDQSENLQDCVTKYFLENSQCNDVGTPDDEPVFRPIFYTYAPSLNMTAIPIISYLSGLDGQIEEFYINKKTQNLVMSVAYENILMDSPALSIVIDQRGDPPKVVIDFNTDTHVGHLIMAVTLTAVIPLKDGLTPAALKAALVSPYFNSADVKVETGNEFRTEEGTAQEVAKIIKKIEEDPLTLSKELFVTEAHSLFLAYLQKYICDFSLNICLV